MTSEEEIESPILPASQSSTSMVSSSIFCRLPRWRASIFRGDPSPTEHHHCQSRPRHLELIEVGRLRYKPRRDGPPLWIIDFFPIEKSHDEDEKSRKKCQREEKKEQCFL